MAFILSIPVTFGTPVFIRLVLSLSFLYQTMYITVFFSTWIVAALVATTAKLRVQAEPTTWCLRSTCAATWTTRGRLARSQWWARRALRRSCSADALRSRWRLARRTTRANSRTRSRPRVSVYLHLKRLWLTSSTFKPLSASTCCFFHFVYSSVDLSAPLRSTPRGHSTLVDRSRITQSRVA